MHTSGIVDPRIDLTGEFLCHVGRNPDFAAVEIPYEIASATRLPDFLWVFHRICGNDSHIINPHFYSYALFTQKAPREVLPLGNWNGRGDEEWTEIISVYGDSKEGPIKIISQDGTVQRVFTAVTQCLGPVTPMIVFKGLLTSWGNSLVYIYTVPIDIEGRLLAEDEVDFIFSRARDLKCFRWRDSSFVLDPDVRSVQDVVNSSKVRPFCGALGRP